MLLLIRVLRQQKNRELPGAVRSENEDAFDIAGAAGTGDEGKEAGPVRRV